MKFISNHDREKYLLLHVQISSRREGGFEIPQEKHPSRVNDGESQTVSAAIQSAEAA